MEGRITLHREHGVNPSLATYQCPVDGKTFEGGEILLLGGNRGKKADKYTCVGVKPCPECEELLKTKIALIGCDSSKMNKDTFDSDKVKPDEAYRTGHIAWVGRNVFGDIFNVEAPEKGIMFCDQEVIDKLQAMSKG